MRAGQRISDGQLSSFNNLELLQFFFFDGDSEARNVIPQVNGSVLCLWFAVEYIPEKLVTDLYINDRKIFRYRRVETGHHDMEVVHLARVRNYGNRVRFGQRRNLSSL